MPCSRHSRTSATTVLVWIVVSCCINPAGHTNWATVILIGAPLMHGCSSSSLERTAYQTYQKQTVAHRLLKLLHWGPIWAVVKPMPEWLVCRQLIAVYADLRLADPDIQVHKAHHTLHSSTICSYIAYKEGTCEHQDATRLSQYQAHIMSESV